MSKEPALLVSLYVKHMRRQVQQAAEDPDVWIRSTRRFGAQLIVVGVVLLGVCLLLPDDSRRWLFVGVAAVTTLAGYWHRKHAEQIALLSQR